MDDVQEYVESMMAKSTIMMLNLDCSACMC
jgi:hypothetical protein